MNHAGVILSREDGEGSPPQVRRGFLALFGARNDTFIVAIVTAIAHFLYFYLRFGSFYFPDSFTYLEPAKNLLAGRGFVSGTPLAAEMLAGGLRARLTCIDPRVMPRELAGREFDHALLAELPPGVDPCGERGEFHTFCYSCPEFTSEIRVEAGESVHRDGFWFADLLRGR